MECLAGFLLPFAAGNYVYVAGSDLVPELLDQKDLGKGLSQFGLMALGGAADVPSEAALGLAELVVLDHQHGHGGCVGDLHADASQHPVEDAPCAPVTHYYEVNFSGPGCLYDFP